jgi:single-strand DNA-binding protein
MNKVLLIGRLTKDVDLRKTQNGTSYARFTLAVNRRFKGNDPQGQDADFISCVAWDKRAEVMYQYLGKGSQVGIEGRIQTGSYERDGQRVYTTDVVVENFDFLESRQQRQQAQAQSQPYFPDDSSYAASPQTTSNDDAQEDFDSEPILDIASDDLPF